MSPAEPRVIEQVATWREASDRQRQLREAGYHAQAVDMGEAIHLIIDGGPRGNDLARIPPRR